MGLVQGAFAPVTAGNFGFVAFFVLGRPRGEKMTSKADSSVLGKVQGISEDLEAMLSVFARLVASSRVSLVQGDAKARVGGSELSDVFVESLVASASAALEKLAAVNTSLSLGNQNNQLYNKVKQTQRALDTTVVKHSQLFSLAAEDSAMHEMHDLLAQLEGHYYTSLVPPPADDGAVQLEADLEELCQQALVSALHPKAGGRL